MDMGNVLFFDGNQFEIVFDRNKAILDKQKFDKEMPKKKLLRKIVDGVCINYFLSYLK